MKIKVNAIGCTERKFLTISEAMIKTGIITGILATLCSFGGYMLITKSQKWYVGSTPEHFNHMADIVNGFESMFK